MATNKSITPSKLSLTPTTSEADLRSVIVDALRELETRVVPDLVGAIALEHDLIDPGSVPSCCHEIHTRRLAKTLGTIAAIIAKIDAAAKQVAVLFLLAVIATMAFGQNNAACVPFKIINHHTIVLVKVGNAGPFSFLLDTGAQSTLVDSDLFKVAHLVKVGDAVLAGIGNSGTPAAIAHVSISVGGQTEDNVKAIEYDMRKVQGPGDARMYGVIGQNFLENFTVIIDYQHSCLSLQ